MRRLVPRSTTSAGAAFELAFQLRVVAHGGGHHREDVACHRVHTSATATGTKPGRAVRRRRRGAPAVTPHVCHEWCQ